MAFSPTVIASKRNPESSCRKRNVHQLLHGRGLLTEEALQLPANRDAALQQIARGLLRRCRGRRFHHARFHRSVHGATHERQPLEPAVDAVGEQEVLLPKQPGEPVLQRHVGEVGGDVAWRGDGAADVRLAGLGDPPQHLVERDVAQLHRQPVTLHLDDRRRRGGGGAAPGAGETTGGAAPGGTVAPVAPALGKGLVLTPGVPGAAGFAARPSGRGGACATGGGSARDAAAERERDDRCAARHGAPSDVTPHAEQESAARRPGEQDLGSEHRG